MTLRDYKIGNLECENISASGITGMPTGANPTATATGTAINGTALTFMRSDASPAIQSADATHNGLLTNTDWNTFNSKASTQVADSTHTGLLTSTDWSTFNGKANTSALPVAGNPTTTASGVAYNGVATTFMRSDAVPAIQSANSSHTGLLTFTDWQRFDAATGNSAVGANPTATATGTVINGSATTYMRSDAAPAIQIADTTHTGLITSTDWNTFNGKANTSAIPTAANPTALASGVAVNGTSTNFMRADACPQIQIADATHTGLISHTDWNTFNSNTGGGWTVCERTDQALDTTKTINFVNTSCGWTYGGSGTAIAGGTTDGQLLIIYNLSGGYDIVVNEDGNIFVANGSVSIPCKGNLKLVWFTDTWRQI